MKILVWAALFLVLAVAGSALGLAGIIGAPIGGAAESVFGVVASALAVWGIVLFFAPRWAAAFVLAAPGASVRQETP
jgi:hypothetical protein